MEVKSGGKQEKEEKKSLKKETKNQGNNNSLFAAWVHFAQRSCIRHTATTTKKCVWQWSPLLIILNGPTEDKH